MQINYLFHYRMLLHIANITAKKSDKINTTKINKNVSRSVVSYRAVYSLVLLRDKCTLILVFKLFHNLQDKFL